MKMRFLFNCVQQNIENIYELEKGENKRKENLYLLNQIIGVWVNDTTRHVSWINPENPNWKISKFRRRNFEQRKKVRVISTPSSFEAQKLVSFWKERALKTGKWLSTEQVFCENKIKIQSQKNLNFWNS